METSGLLMSRTKNLGRLRDDTKRIRDDATYMHGWNFLPSHMQEHDTGIEPHTHFGSDGNQDFRLRSNMLIDMERSKSTAYLRWHKCTTQKLLSLILKSILVSEKQYQLLRGKFFVNLMICESRVYLSPSSLRRWIFLEVPIGFPHYEHRGLQPSEKLLRASGCCHHMRDGEEREELTITNMRPSHSTLSLWLRNDSFTSFLLF